MPSPVPPPGGPPPPPGPLEGDVAVADRAAIADLIARYAVLLDRGDWDGVAGLFTPDARIDYTATGAGVFTPAQFRDFAAATLPGFRRTQHLMGTPAIDLAGDTAQARTPCLNPMVSGAESEAEVWLIGLWYDDTFHRTGEGWRFAARVQDVAYTVTGLRARAVRP